VHYHDHEQQQQEHFKLELFTRLQIKCIELIATAI
jgi:hypothetical protein